MSDIWVVALGRIIPLRRMVLLSSLTKRVSYRGLAHKVRSNVLGASVDLRLLMMIHFAHSKRSCSSMDIVLPKI